MIDKSKQTVLDIKGYRFDIESGLLGNKGVSNGLSVPMPEISPYNEPSPQLQISMTDKCNLSCDYCAFRSRLGADNKPNDMPKPKSYEEALLTSCTIKSNNWQCIIPFSKFSGMQIRVYLQDGRCAKLVRYEPFANVVRSSNCSNLEGGEFTQRKSTVDYINEPKLTGFVPITRFSKLKPNVC